VREFRCGRICAAGVVWKEPDRKITERGDEHEEDILDASHMRGIDWIVYGWAGVEAEESDGGRRTAGSSSDKREL